MTTRGSPDCVSVVAAVLEPVPVPVDVSLMVLDVEALAVAVRLSLVVVPAESEAEVDVVQVVAVDVVQVVAVDVVQVVAVLVDPPLSDVPASGGGGAVPGDGGQISQSEARLVSTVGSTRQSDIPPPGAGAGWPVHAAGSS
jgi:hypothetical protein